MNAMSCERRLQEEREYDLCHWLLKIRKYQIKRSDLRDYIGRCRLGIVHLINICIP